MLKPKKTYKVTVPTTNCLRSTFIYNERYYAHCTPDSTNGFVFIITDTPEKIFKEIPNAIKIEEVGIGFDLEFNKGEN